MFYISHNELVNKLIIAFSLLIPSLGLGQSKVLVQNHPDNGALLDVIQVKWYSQDILYPEGVHVYRRISGLSEWERLTETPLKRLSTVDAAAITRDPDLEVYVDMINEADGIAGLPDEILQLNMVVKSFSNNEFANFLGVYFEDKSVKRGVSYTYRIQRIVDGQERFLGQSNPIEAGDYVKERQVDGFEITQKGVQFYFDWEIEEQRFYGVNLYEQVSDTSAEVKVNENPMVISKIETDSGTLEYPKPKYKKSGLLENVSYNYQIAGLDFFGGETARTLPIAINFNDVTPPLPPTHLEADQDTMLVRLSWQPPVDPQVKELKIYRSKWSQGPFESIYTTSKETTYLDSIEHPGPYYYYVSSFDFSNNASPSRTVFVEIPDQDPPSAPTGLTISADTGVLHLKWSANTDPDLLGYLVYRTAVEGASEHFVLLTGDPLTKPYYKQVLPKNVLNQFSFFIVALDSAENRSMPSDMAIGKMPDVTAPEAPFIKDISYRSDEIELEWTLNVDKDLAGYHVFRSDSLLPLDFDQVNHRLIPGDAGRYIDREIESGKQYVYQMRAMDHTGNLSNASDRVVTGPVRKVLDKEGSVRLDMKHKKRKHQNLLTWYVSDNDWIGFMIYRGSDPSRLKPYSGLISNSVYSFTDSEPLEEKVVYQLRAFDKSGYVVKSEVKVFEN